jgi:hypothetical protein
MANRRLQPIGARSGWYLVPAKLAARSYYYDGEYSGSSTSSRLPQRYVPILLPEIGGVRSRPPPAHLPLLRGAFRRE